MPRTPLQTVWLLFVTASLARADVENGRWTLDSFQTVRDQPAVWADSLYGCSSPALDNAARALGAPGLDYAERRVAPGWTLGADEEGWIDVGFPECLARQIWIVEGQNPGAVREIVAIDSDGSQLVLYRRGRRVPRFLSPRVLWLRLAQPQSIRRLKIFVGRSPLGPGSVDGVALVPEHAPPAESFRLLQQTLLAGESLRVVFATPRQALPGQSLGLRLVLPEAAPYADPLAWLPLRGGEREFRLPVPLDPGSYIVEAVDLLAPEQDASLRQPFTVVLEPDLALGFAVEPVKVGKGSPLRLTFSGAPQPREGEHYWLALCLADAPEAEPGQRIRVASGEPVLGISAPETPGIYELRLHARAPTAAFHLIHRLRLTVE